MEFLTGVRRLILGCNNAKRVGIESWEACNAIEGGNVKLKSKWRMLLAAPADTPQELSHLHLELSCIYCVYT